MTRAIVAGRDRDDWGNAEDLSRIKAERGCDVDIHEAEEPSAEWGWRTGVDVVKGRLTSLEEARAEWKRTEDLRQIAVPSHETENHSDEPHDEEDERETSDNDNDDRLVIPAAGWGRKNHWRDPRLFEGVAAECLNTADLVAYVQSMGFSTSSSTSTRQQ